jgi:hypothetical protein
VRPESLPEVLPAPRDPRRCLPSCGSRGARFPTRCGTMRRSDSPLAVSGGCAWRSLPNTVPAASRAWCPLWAHDLVEAPRSRQGFWSPGPPSREFCAETGGSPTFPRDPWADMPRSETPVVSCARASIAPRMAAVRRMHTVGFALDPAAALLWTTTRQMAGLDTAACLLTSSSCVRP